MADPHLILTVIGDDRPGLVELLSSTIAAHNGNWLDASMAHLAGKFAGIVNIAVPADNVTALKTALAALPGLKVGAEFAIGETTAPAPAGTQTLILQLVGHDRIGIVREVTRILARHEVNVEQFETHTSSAPMSAETHFHCHARLSAASGFDSHALQQAFEQLSDDLMVDINLDSAN